VYNVNIPVIEMAVIAPKGEFHTPATIFLSNHWHCRWSFICML